MSSVVDRLIENAIRRRKLTPENMEGCTDEEIEKVAAFQKQRVEDLPPCYVEFLRRLGKNAGDVHSQFEFQYDELFEFPRLVRALEVLCRSSPGVSGKCAGM